MSILLSKKLYVSIVIISFLSITVVSQHQQLHFDQSFSSSNLPLEVQKETIVNEKSTVVSEKSTVVSEKSTVVNQNDTIVNENDNLTTISRPYEFFKHTEFGTIYSNGSHFTANITSSPQFILNETTNTYEYYQMAKIGNYWYTQHMEQVKKHMYPLQVSHL